MYEMQRQITYSQVGRDLKTDISMITKYFQDCALFHSESIGKGVDDLDGTKKAWFLSSWQIEVVRYPQYKECITVRTWPHGFKGMYGYRNFDILDENGVQIVKANSIWIFMDVNEMRPMKVSPKDMEGYEVEPALEMEYAARKITILGEEYRVEEEMAPIVVKRTYVDSNQHMNNARYVELAMDYLNGDVSINKLRVDYRKACAEGELLHVAKYQYEKMIQIIFEDDEKQPYVIIEMEFDL